MIRLIESTQTCFQVITRLLKAVLIFVLLLMVGYLFIDGSGQREQIRPKWQRWPARSSLEAPTSSGKLL